MDVETGGLIVKESPLGSNLNLNRKQKKILTTITKITKADYKRKRAENISEPKSSKSESALVI